jgi:hypothetical protein
MVIMEINFVKNNGRFGYNAKFNEFKDFKNFITLIDDMELYISKKCKEYEEIKKANAKNKRERGKKRIEIQPEPPKKLLL